MRKLECDPNVETIGVNFLAFFQNLREYQTRPIMEKYGVTEVQPDQWISSQNLLNALNEMAQSPDYMSGLVAMGMEIGKIVPISLEKPTLGDVLMIWDSVYQSLHRNGDAGHLKCEKVDDNHYTVTFTDLYPDDFSYGIMYGYAQRFLPPGADFSIFYDPEVTPRDRGGQQGYTVIHAKWK